MAERTAFLFNGISLCLELEGVDDAALGMVRFKALLERARGSALEDGWPGKVRTWRRWL